MRQAVLFVLATSILPLMAGCNVETTVVPLSPPGVSYDPVPPEDVFVFAAEERVQVKYEPLAHLTTEKNYEGLLFGEDPSLEAVFLEKAGKLGAHGIILGSHVKTAGVEIGTLSDSDFDGTRATAIRFLDPDDPRLSLAPRSPSESLGMVVAPLGIPQDLPVPDSVVTAMLQAIHTMVEDGGFRPLPLDMWETARAETEGIHLPDSMRDEAEWETEEKPDSATAVEQAELALAQEDRVVETLAADWGVDCVLFPDIQGVLASFSGDEARWDGVSQKVGKTRSTGAKILSGFLNILVRGEHETGEEGPPDPEGEVWALSLTVVVENAIGARIYEGRGGIELLEGADFEGGIYIGEVDAEEYEVEEIPMERLFRRPGRIRRAVRLALEGLFHPGDAPF